MTREIMTEMLESSLSVGGDAFLQRAVGAGH